MSLRSADTRTERGRTERLFTFTGRGGVSKLVRRASASKHADFNRLGRKVCLLTRVKGMRDNASGFRSTPFLIGVPSRVGKGMRCGMAVRPGTR